jgi:hypothetical protein
MCRSALPLGSGKSDDARMTAASELLIAVAVLVLLAVVAGTFAARLFMAASRPRSGGGIDPKV